MLNIFPWKANTPPLPSALPPLRQAHGFLPLPAPTDCFTCTSRFNGLPEPDFRSSWVWSTGPWAHRGMSGMTSRTPFPSATRAGSRCTVPIISRLWTRSSRPTGWPKKSAFRSWCAMTAIFFPTLTCPLTCPNRKRLMPFCRPFVRTMYFVPKNRPTSIP